jgi:hypothetical protein
MESKTPGTTSDNTKLAIEKEDDFLVEELTPSEGAIVTGGRVSFWDGGTDTPAT